MTTSLKLLRTKVFLPKHTYFSWFFKKTIMTPSRPLAHSRKSPLHCHASSSVLQITTSTVLPTLIPVSLSCPSKVTCDLSKRIFHSGTSKRVTRSEQEDRSRKYHRHFPVSSPWISVSALEYFTSIQNRQKDCTGVEFAKTHVLNIWNSVRVFGTETEREIFNPASVMGERLLAGLQKHAKPRVCVCACAQLHRGKHAQRGRQQKSPATDGSLGHLALIW